MAKKKELPKISNDVIDGAKRISCPTFNVNNQHETIATVRPDSSETELKELAIRIAGLKNINDKQHVIFGILALLRDFSAVSQIVGQRLLEFSDGVEKYRLSNQSKTNGDSLN